MRHGDTPALVLQSADASRFELRIYGYQFADAGGNLHDDNWLRVGIVVAAPCGSWKASGAVLLTWEVAELADWLVGLAQAAHSAQPELEFLEPNLRFAVRERRSEQIVLRIYFELEMRPHWASKGWVGEADLWVDLHVAPQDLRLASERLSASLSHFPQRGTLPSPSGER